MIFARLIIALVERWVFGVPYANTFYNILFSLIEFFVESFPHLYFHLNCTFCPAPHKT